MYDVLQSAPSVLPANAISDISVDWLSGDIAPDPWIYTPTFSATLDASTDDVCLAMFDSMLSNSI